MQRLLPTLFFLLYFSFAETQTFFTKVEDSNNPITAQIPIGIYLGASWVDYNSDGLLDLFVNSNSLYRNDGNEQFTKVPFSDINFGFGNGNSWGDIDRDGDLDVLIAASPSKYYRNDDSTFVETPLTETAISNLRFWSVALGDYNEDGWLDAYFSHPARFLGNDRTSLLLVNNQDGSFSPVTDTPIDKGLAAYTIGSWTDYDRDGDLDLFVGSGEVDSPSKDHIYINQLAETDTANFIRMTDGALAEDTRDGQNWNFIDYDNDGDLDAFVTNYLSNVDNHFYQNQDSSYVKLTAAEVGSIAEQGGSGLTNLWADFDNDGYLDCFVVFDGQQDRFYHNNGDGTFSELDEEPMAVTGQTRGATAGDYNNDGFQDLFIASAGASTVGLYKNNGNTNNFATFTLKSSADNPVALHTKVWAKATIDGQEMWQYREINSQNSFNGHNDYRVHFGLGDATMIDTMWIEWPLGARELYTDVQAGDFCTIIQGEEASCGVLTATKNPVQPSETVVISPNPTGEMATVAFDFPNTGTVQIEVYTLSGKRLPHLSQRQQAQNGTVQLDFSNEPAGIYLITARQGNAMQTGRILVQR